LDELWENAEKINIHNADTYVFNIESLLITLSLHLDKHFKNKKFQFTGFYDIANLLNEYKSEINWTLFKTNCKNWNADKHVYPYLLLTHKYLGAHLPESVLNNAELDKQTENIFLNSMQGVIMREDNAQSNFNSIQHFQGNWAKLKFILNMIFPPPAYLMQRYKLKNSLSLIIYYPIRFFSELKLGLKVFFGYNK
jgi:hypothetical protein